MSKGGMPGLQGKVGYPKGAPSQSSPQSIPSPQSHHHHHHHHQKGALSGISSGHGIVRGPLSSPHMHRTPSGGILHVARHSPGAIPLNIPAGKGPLLNKSPSAPSSGGKAGTAIFVSNPAFREADYGAASSSQSRPSSATMRNERDAVGREREGKTSSDAQDGDASGDDGFDFMKPGETLKSAKQLKEEGLQFVEDILLHFYEEREYIVAKALLTAKSALRDNRLADRVKLNVREVRKILDNVLVPQYICESVPAGNDVRYRISPFACAVLCYRVRLLLSKAKNSTEKATENNYECLNCLKEFDEWRVIEALTSGIQLCCGELSTKKVADSVDAKYEVALERLNSLASGPLRKIILDWYEPELETRKRKTGPNGSPEPSMDGEDENEKLVPGEDREAIERREQERNKHLMIPWLAEETKKLVANSLPAVDSPSSVSHLCTRTRPRRNRSEDNYKGAAIDAASLDFERVLQLLAHNSS